jgi:hypothetical protein
MYVCTYVRINVYVYVCTHVCMYIPVSFRCGNTRMHLSRPNLSASFLSSSTPTPLLASLLALEEDGIDDDDDDDDEGALKEGRNMLAGKYLRISTRTSSGELYSSLT